MAQIFDAINVYFAFTAVIINAVFVMLVLVRTSRTAFYMTFLWLCVAAIIWNFGIFMTYFKGRGPWFYIALIGSPLMPALLYHFIHTMTRPLVRTAWITAAYVLSGLLSISSFLALFHHGIRRFVDSNSWNIYFLGVLFPFILGGMVIMYRSLTTLQKGEQRNRMRYFLWAMVIGTLMGFTDLIQIFNIPVPKLGHLGSVIYSTVIVVGMFKHRRAYDILAQMQVKMELLSAMAADIAHELRNPMSSVKGASRLLVSELEDGRTEKAREYAGIITEEVARLDSILDNLRQLTRPQSVQRTPCSINEVIRKTVRLAEIGSLPIRISERLHEGLPEVSADAAALRQVILNLIKNASEACTETGTLVVRTDYVKPWVRIVFADNGTGIPAEQIEQIFQPFFTTKESGMGLGLAICQRIIEAHNGRIEARNIPTGGAEFSVLLPA